MDYPTVYQVTTANLAPEEIQAERRSEAYLPFGCESNQHDRSLHVEPLVYQNTTANLAPEEIQAERRSEAHSPADCPSTRAPDQGSPFTAFMQKGSSDVDNRPCEITTLSTSRPLPDTPILGLRTATLVTDFTPQCPDSKACEFFSSDKEQTVDPDEMLSQDPRISTPAPSGNRYDNLLQVEDSKDSASPAPEEIQSEAHLPSFLPRCHCRIS